MPLMKGNSSARAWVCAMVCANVAAARAVMALAPTLIQYAAPPSSIRLKVSR